MKTRELVRDIVGDVAILSGHVVGPSDASWQDVAGTLATNLEVMASRLHKMRRGETAVDLPNIEDMLSDIEYQMDGTPLSVKKSGRE